jgi:hypothetical protein
MRQIVALRAQWVVQLGEAIESAQRVAWQLGTREDMSGEARDLYGQLEAARVELDSLRGMNCPIAASPELDWLHRFGWASEPRAGSIGDGLGRQVPCGSSPPPENGSRNGSIEGAFHPAVATKPRLMKARLP